MVNCDYGYIQTTEKSSFGDEKNACRHCGRTKEWHEQKKEQELPADIQATEFLELAGLSKHVLFEQYRIILTRYIEWQKSALP